MKTAFRISFLVNLLLLGVVCYRAQGPKVQGRPATPFLPPVLPHSALRLSRPANTSTVFDWGRQVEAADYPTYIANLRAIRCPEQTIRDIIKSDVANLFAQRRQELSDSSAAGRWSAQKEAELIASLFGDAVAQSVSTFAVNASDKAPVRLPLILQTQALARLNLNNEQREELGELAQEFIEEVGGVNQDPNDPAYLAKWQKAQPKFDQLIVTAIGRRALVDLDEAMPPPDPENQ